MEIIEKQQNGYYTLTPVGDLDANSSLEMDACINGLLQKDIVNLHIDCSQLKYISSAGLGVFISFIDEIEQKGGKIIFSHLTESVFDVFELLGLNQIVTIVTNGEEVSPLFSS